ncbi:MAG: accessory factor UbiK family protein [Gammaproteobacteria bacterium]|nr:accessory factor UbiK family protein [Gammaproteobacteria bacterium]
MIDKQVLDDITRKFSAALPDGLKSLQSDLEHNLRAAAEAAFSKMNLVSREEFDVQAALLAKTQQRLKQLEQQLLELEKQLN